MWVGLVDIVDLQVDEDRNMIICSYPSGLVWMKCLSLNAVIVGIDYQNHLDINIHAPLHYFD